MNKVIINRFKYLSLLFNYLIIFKELEKLMYDPFGLKYLIITNPYTFRRNFLISNLDK